MSRSGGTPRNCSQGFLSVTCNLAIGKDHSTLMPWTCILKRDHKTPNSRSELARSFWAAVVRFSFLLIPIWDRFTDGNSSSMHARISETSFGHSSFLDSSKPLKSTKRPGHVFEVKKIYRQPVEIFFKNQIRFISQLVFSVVCHWKKDTQYIPSDIQVWNDRKQLSVTSQKLCKLLSQFLLWVFFII